MAQKPRIGIIANPTKLGAAENLSTLAEAFDSEGLGVIFDKPTATLLGAGTLGLDHPDFASACDIIVVMGGDGTMLHAANLIGDSGRPVAGINTGTLGFLTAATMSELSTFVTAIKDTAYEVINRAMILVEVVVPDGEPLYYHGLNEMTLMRSNVAGMIRVETQVNGDFLNRYHADGLIVATPTGSTAYSLSAGGPIVSPGAGVFTITPICPHALSDRAVLVSDTAVIEICAHESRDDVVLSVDNRVLERHHPATVFRISRAPYDLPLIQLPGYQFFDVLRNKLGWTGSSV